eukprot:EG_transcript_21335
MYCGLGTLVVAPMGRPLHGAASLVALSRALAADPDWSALRSLGGLNRRLALMAPAALCQLLVLHNLVPPAPATDQASPTVHVVVVGAEELDYFDEGLWFGLSPALLGVPFSLKVDFVGPQLTPTPLGVVPDRVRHAVRCRGVRCDLAGYVDGDGACEVASGSVVVFFNPGFGDTSVGAKHVLADGSLRRLLTRGPRCFWTAYALDEFLEDCASLRAHGFDPSPPIVNRYCKHFTNPLRETKWAGYLGEIRVP